MHFLRSKCSHMEGNKVKYLIWGLGRTTRTFMKSEYLDMARVAGFIDKDTRTYVHSGGECL